jgi:uncharacterized protein
MILTRPQQDTLLGVAREAVEYGLARGRPPQVHASDFDEVLRTVLASFVTLHLDGQLRGCIGALEASKPLVVDVSLHGYGAAFGDPRFPPVRADEAPRLDYHVSVLSPSTPIVYGSEAELLNLLRPGVDGLTIAEDGRRATFLPTVWSTLPDPATFLTHLKRKAGMADDARGFSAWRYTTLDIPAE